MKKQLRAILFFALSLTSVVGLNAQTAVINCGFDNYAGTTATIPAGFYISWNSTSPTAPGPSASFYTSAGNFGATAPSYKFGVDSATMVTPMVTNADSIVFWGKGNGISGPSELSISYSADSITWTPITALNNLPTSGTTFSVPLTPAVTGYIRFFYHKDVGNLAFDDLRIYSNTGSSGINENSSREDVRKVFYQELADAFPHYTDFEFSPRSMPERF